MFLFVIFVNFVILVAAAVGSSQASERAGLIPLRGSHTMTA